MPALGPNLPPRALLTIAVLAAGCGGAASASGDCPEGMARVSGGRYVVGVESPAAPWEEPAHEVELGAFCMDRYEYPNQAGVLPLHTVSWREADDACRSAGKRLCTAAEWERACRGVERHRYVYGDELDPARCYTPFHSPDAEISGPTYVPAGSYPDCVSPEGIYDLDGSLSEWVADTWSGDIQPFDRGLDPGEPRRTVRGSTLWWGSAYGQDCLSRHGHPPSGTYADDGFRCCK